MNHAPTLLSHTFCCLCQAKARKVVVRKAKQAVEQLTRPQELDAIQVRPTTLPSVIVASYPVSLLLQAGVQAQRIGPDCCASSSAAEHQGTLSGFRGPPCRQPFVNVVLQDGDKQETDRNYENMWRQLRSVVGIGQRVALIRLVCNSKSFAQTVENIFTLSFLVSALDH
jgi:hypothetical protein